MSVAQISIYLPEDIEQQLRRKARKARKSFSAYLVDLARRELRPPRWPKSFAKLYGSCAGDLPAIEDLPPDEQDPL